MPSFLVTALEAAKLPRWGLLLLCVLYIGAGIVGRDPWRGPDAISVGIVQTMAEGSARDWLLPNVAGARIVEYGPLLHWTAAVLVGAGGGVVDAHLATRIVTAALIAGLLAGLWYATYLLARRPETQPADPIGAAASRTDFGRAVADCALLILLASLGLVDRVHEASVDTLQLTLVAATLLGLVLALRRPKTGGTLAGVAIGGSTLAGGVPIALALLAVLLVLPLVVRQYQLVRRALLACGLVSALLAALSWPLALAAGDQIARAHLEQWIVSNLALQDLPALPVLGAQARNALWFLWPAWPMAAWALWSWRTRLAEPATGVPLLVLGAMLALVLTGTQGSEAALLPLVPAAAMLAAIGLPSLSRSVINLIDWFAVLTFSLLGLASWAYWIAYQLGAPAPMAASVTRLLPGFEPDPGAGWALLAALLGIAATVGWLWLVRWRISRQPRAMWRAVLLSGGGLVLTWVLLMTLWHPMYDHRKTFRHVALPLAAALPASYDCVQTSGVSLSARASFLYFGGVRFAPSASPPRRCDWLLVEDRRPEVASDPGPNWIVAYEGYRLGPRSERYRLFRLRQPQAQAGRSSGGGSMIVGRDGS